MKMQKEDLFGSGTDLIGPGTDLIISLIALLFVILLTMISFYADTIDIAKLFSYIATNATEELKKAKVAPDDNNRLLDKLRKEFDKIQRLEQEVKYWKEIAEREKQHSIQLGGQIAKIPKKPFAIPLKETSGFKFESGKTDLSLEFKNNFRKEILPEISKYFEQYEVNLIEVIGHTDGQHLSQGRLSNLDNRLPEFDLDNASQAEVMSLTSGSNADLGLVRALAVAQFISKELKSTQYASLRGVKCRAYSAAQLISPKTNLVEGAPVMEDRNRRRIELRFTKLVGEADDD